MTSRSGHWALPRLLAGTMLALIVFGAPIVARADDSGCETSGWNSANHTEIRSCRSETSPVEPGISAGPSLTPSEARDRAFWEAQRERLDREPTCASYGTCVEPEPKPARPPRNVTVADIASFVPDAPTVESEPSGFSIVGVATNFVMRAAPQVKSGELLGWTAEVRFTPVASHWRHTDGTAIDVDTLGSPWATLGQAAFTDTATSHRYTAAGTVAVATSIDFATEFRVDGGDWIPIAGIVTVEGPTLTLRVFQGHTALVERLCAPGSPAPGC